MTRIGKYFENRLIGNLCQNKLGLFDQFTWQKISEVNYLPALIKEIYFTAFQYSVLVHKCTSLYRLSFLLYCCVISTLFVSKVNKI